MIELDIMPHNVYNANRVPCKNICPHEKESAMKSVKWFTTTEQTPWQSRDYTPATNDVFTHITAEDADQTIVGFGGCFNELGGVALQKLSPADQSAVLALLFAPDGDGLRLNYNRMSIGASDYGARWYSYNEHPGDYEMAHFSIDEDRPAMLPYIKAAYAQNADMQLFGSP